MMPKKKYFYDEQFWKQRERVRREVSGAEYNKVMDVKFYYMLFMSTTYWHQIMRKKLSSVLRNFSYRRSSYVRHSSLSSLNVCKVMSSQFHFFLFATSHAVNIFCGQDFELNQAFNSIAFHYINSNNFSLINL
jgi:hypothetical protein